MKVFLSFSGRDRASLNEIRRFGTASGLSVALERTQNLIIVISNLLRHHWKAKSMAPVYSRASLSTYLEFLFRGMCQHDDHFRTLLNASSSLSKLRNGSFELSKKVASRDTLSNESRLSQRTFLTELWQNSL